MERKKRKLKDNVGSYNESCECGSASTKGYVAYFGVQECPKILKDEGFLSTIRRFLPIKYGAILQSCLVPYWRYAPAQDI